MSSIIPIINPDLRIQFDDVVVSCVLQTLGFSGSFSIGSKLFITQQSQTKKTYLFIVSLSSEFIQLISASNENNNSSLE